MSKRFCKVAKPEWLDYAMPRVEANFQLYKQGKMPECIQVFMLTTPIKHALRSIYGKNNLGVACTLLLEAIQDKIKYAYWHVRWKLGLDRDESN